MKKYINEKNTFYEDEEIYNKKAKYTNHPHDKAIRNILSDKQEAAILINQMLKLEGIALIKPSEIIEYKTDFITQDYFNREIDIIYQDLTQKNVFYLIEHQSKVDYRMPMRLIEYYSEVMKNTYKNREPKKKYEMPIIIPIVIYSGDGKWKASVSLRQEILPIRGIIPLPLGSYKVFDVNNYTDDELIKKPGILTKVLSLENAKNIVQIQEKANKIAKCKLKDKEKSYLNQYITHIIGEKYGKNETNIILKKINRDVKEEKSMLSDVLDQIEERGIEIGMRKGEKRGIVKCKKAIEKELLKRGMSKEEVEKIVHLNIE